MWIWFSRQKITIFWGHIDILMKSGNKRDRYLFGGGGGWERGLHVSNLMLLKHCVTAVQDMLNARSRASSNSHTTLFKHNNACHTIKECEFYFQGKDHNIFCEQGNINRGTWDRCISWDEVAACTQFHVVIKHCYVRWQCRLCQTLVVSHVWLSKQ